MKVSLRFSAIVFLLTISAFSQAARLYWVGGTGNFNDPAHWSYESGGVGGVKSPSAFDDVYFDENSFAGPSVISFIGNTEVHDLIFTQYTGKAILSGMQHEKITIHGNLKLNAYVDNQFFGDIKLLSTQPSTDVNFSLSKLKGRLYFDGNTIWNLEGILAGVSNSSVYFNSGTFNLKGSTIEAGNLYFTAGITVNSKSTTLTALDKFIMPVGVVMNDGGNCRVIGRKNDPSKFQIDPSVIFNSSSRFSLSTVLTTCDVVNTVNVNPTCAGGCNGTMTFTVPATCSSNPVYAVWSTGSGCTAIATATVAPGATYTESGICGCGTLYGVIFTNDPNTLDSTYATFNIPIADPIPQRVKTFTKTSPTCFGYCDGMVIATIDVYGQNPFVLTWTTPMGVITHTVVSYNGKDTIFNACAGTYSVNITDANGCVTPQTFTTNLTQPTQVVGTVSTTSLACNNVCTGSITNATSGGTGALSCTLNGLPMPGCTASSLCAGTYTVITNDANMCADTDIVTIAQPLPITFTRNPANGIVNISCNNTCNGSIGVVGVAGGTAPYTFSWTPGGGSVANGATSSTYSGLCGSPGGTTYTCTITDNNNCTTTATFTVISPPALSNTITTTQPRCVAGQGSSTGSSTVTASGGVAAYTFTWSPSGGTQSGVSPSSIYSNMSPGTYTVVFTDANGCTDTATTTITPPTAVSATITTQTNPGCPSLSNGQLCVTPGGGTGVYTYTWSPIGGNAACTPATLTVTAGGSSTYTVIVSDNNSCTVTATATLTSPPAATINSSVTDVTCGSAPCSASATLTPSGGTGPFTYQWSCSASVTNTISGQCGGSSCNYTVTDVGTNCTYTGTVSFNPPPSTLTVSISATALACAGDCNSTITSTVSGGTPGYTYSWTGTGANPVNPNSSNQTNMCAGNYTCQVTDNVGCTRTATLSISSPPALTVTLNATQPTCNTSCDGSILATVTGGTSPYPGVSWSPSIAPNPPGTLNPTGLCGTLAPGTTYTLTITDNNGCQGTGTATLITPPALTVTVAADSATCRGLCNGTATATVGGGTPGYTYSWDNGAFTTSSTVSGLCAGQHTLVVEDTNSCAGTTQIFDIFEPTQLATTVINVVNTCGPCTGSADANPTGGTPPYTYTWSPAGGNGSSATGLCIGAYTLTVNDANNCGPVTATFTVNPIVSISIAVSSQSVSCNNACDGVASASASAGTAPYNMVWTSSPSGTVVTTCPSVTSCTATSLCPGTYVITATDQNGCVNSDSVVIGNPPLLVANHSVTNATCFATCGGSATVTPVGGATPYTVTWSTGASGTTISGLCAGPYSYTVTDNRGCTATNSFTITSNTQLSYTTSATTPVACAGATGSLQVTGLNGTAPYTFTWAPSGTGTVTTVSPTSTLSGVAAGVYTVTIADASGCDTTIQITLSDPGSPTITPTVIDETCFGACDGSATVTAVGTPVVTLTWPGGTPTGTSPIVATALCQGVYAVQAVDGNGCVAFQNVTISGPTQITYTPATIVQPNCSNGGSITVTPGGGSGAGYTFNWDGGAQSGNPATGLAAGVHTVVITDGSLCSATYTFNLTPTSTPTITVTPVNTQCSYLTNGSASASVSGGIATYTYTWSSAGSGVISSGPNVTNVNNIPPDSYTVSVTDGNGCTTQQTFTISSATAISDNFGKNDNLCNGGCTGSATVSPTGGTGTYTVSWSPGALSGTTVSSLCPQNYTVVISDGNGCTDTTAFAIVAPALLTVTHSQTDPPCFGASTGSATITISGGTPGYAITWSPNICANCTTVTNLGAGPYSVTVADTNGCTDVHIININAATQITSTIAVVSPLCVNDCNGSVVSNTGGGTGPYTYTWSPGGTASNTPTSTTYTNLCAGNYTLITNDALGCADTSVHTVNQPAPLNMTASATNANCGVNNGSITISSVSGTGTVSVNWLNPSTCGSSLSCGSLGLGVYSFELTDANGCKDTFFVAVSNPNGPQIDSLMTHSNCFQVCNGVIIDSVVSGVNVVTPYTFTWTPSTPGTITTGTNSSTFAGLCQGQYICVVTDSLNCGTATTFTVSEPPQIQDNGNFTNATCQGINDGSITSVASGGTPGTTGYTYTLDGTTTNTTGVFNGLSVGVHTVCINDSVSCQVCVTYTIGANSAILSQVASTNIDCNGNCNGTGTLSNVNGGTAPYVISWNDPNAQSGVSAMNLCQGSYTATITDNNGCMATQTVSIAEPTPLSVNLVSVDPSCGQCNGTLTINASGGTPGVLTAYTYTWNTGATSSSIGSVCAGIYQVNVTDSLGCMQSFQLPVSNSNAPTVTVTSTSPVCTNLCTGSATVTASGGSTPYTYTWPVGGQTGTSISNQCAGLYFVQVKDSLGCIATDSVQINSGTVLSVSSTMNNPPCGVCTGLIAATVSGGTGTYSYNWLPGGSTNDTISGICAGNYTLIVTDVGNGCTDTSIIGLNNNSNGPILTFTSVDVLCNAACNGTTTVSAVGGTPGYTYNWSNGQTTPTLGGLCPGTYALTVTDANNCVQTGQVVISEPNVLIASLPISSQPLCNNDCNGSINLVVSGGTPNYQYAWNPGTVTGSSGSGLCAGNYSCTVTDTNGCTVNVFDTLVNPPALVLTGTVVPATCSNASDGAINTTTSGGTPSLTSPGYSWQWSGGSTSTNDTITGVPIGNYTVVVTDSRNCTDTVPFTVVSTITVTANAGNDTANCALGSITLNGTVSAGSTVQWIQLPNPPLTVVGSTASVTVTPTLGNTQYVLIAQNGACSISDTVLVVSDSLPTPDAGPSVYVFTGFTTTIGGQPTNPSGGTIYWSPGSGMTDSTVANPVVSPTVTTTYTVYETNSNGCVGFDTVTVSVLPEFVIPNGFSPNGDGINDSWQIDLIYLFPDCEVEVFNRWGEPLFYSKGYNTPWNGTYKGKHVPVGTYYYLIRLHDKEKKFPDHYTGPLTILR